MADIADCTVRTISFATCTISVIPLLEAELTFLTFVFSVVVHQLFKMMTCTFSACWGVPCLTHSFKVTKVSCSSLFLLQFRSIIFLLWRSRLWLRLWFHYRFWLFLFTKFLIKCPFSIFQFELKSFTTKIIFFSHSLLLTNEILSFISSININSYSSIDSLNLFNLILVLL